MKAFFIVEGELEVKTASFIKDLLKMLDEIKTANDIVEMWHIDPQVADKVFDIFQEVIFCDQNLPNTSDDAAVRESIDYDDDNLDISTDSEIL